MAAKTVATTTVSVALTAFQVLVYQQMMLIKDALVRVSNQRTNDLQKVANSNGGISDSETANQVAASTGEARSALAANYIPSLTSCRAESANRRFSKAVFTTGRQTAYATTQRESNDYASNAIAGPSGKGSLQASQNTFKDMMDGFCDSSVLKPPTGVNCTLAKDSQGQDMDFRFTQPYLAVFGVKDGLIPPSKTDPENRAARLFVRMAIEPFPTDAIRGNALVRNDGQNLAIRRQSDIAALSLARTALDRLVDDRIGTAAAGDESVEHLRQKAWNNANQFVEDAKSRAGQNPESNMDDISSLIADNNKIYFQLLINLERLAAIRATTLARNVRQTSIGGVSTVSVRGN